MADKPHRICQQPVLPALKPASRHSGYNPFPSFPLQRGSVSRGIPSLAAHLSAHTTVIIDGYIGILWDDLRERMDESFNTLGIRASWIDVSCALRSQEEIGKLAEPFLGGDDPLFGTRTGLQLPDFFDHEKLHEIAGRTAEMLTICYGTGAFLTGLNGLNVYIDLPKNEIQYRSRAGSITNLGMPQPDDPKKMYKRFYFIDWIVLNRHKEIFLDQIDVFADGQRPDDITWAAGDDIRNTLDAMSVNFFRVRPWFEPGAWGGNWIRTHIKGLSDEVPNYAWSFELISPENGLLIESENRLLELSFDWLMYRSAPLVLGNCHARFGNEFPIRFDFLDTMAGGNLSIQCHPHKEYMKSHFGEEFTQEEAYYILDAEPDATVYLGFRDEADPEVLREALETSFHDRQPLDVERFVQKHPSRKHDFFLIPPGTVHGAGRNNLVLEISSTPYIFTFKLYDWLRPDLDGKPRQLSISRGMDNLRFDRYGDTVIRELISSPVLIDKGQNWELWRLPTHADHLYDVHRVEFTGEIHVETEGRCHVLSLVEGAGIVVKTAAGMQQKFSYAETFIIPAAAGSYRVINESASKAMLIKAFVK